MTNRLTVACKLPHGMNTEITDPDTGETVILNGANHESAARSGGYGITENVPADAFEKWTKDRGDSFLPVKNKLLVWGADAKKVVDQAREQSEVVNGFEPVDPDSRGVQTDADTMNTGDAAQKALAAKTAAKR